ncbi:MAG: FAD-dependent oxidoreductase [Streptosporangiales bacterium]|nr:FAD-dependent oxidoreductase [Streptosporangiales bacterium]
MQHVDVAVVGLGLAGSAVTRSLARRGRSVAAFEAFPAGHRRGSSHGNGRIFRHAYGDPLYVRLAAEAGELWDELQKETGETLLERVGGVDHGPRREPERMGELLAEHGIPTELLDPDDAEERWPGVRFNGPVLYDPAGGVLNPERTMTALVRLARESGARVAYETPVRSLEPDGQGVRVTAGDETWHARTVVVAAGAWAGGLLDGYVALPPLTVTQQQVFFFAPARIGSWPWPTLVHDEVMPLYALPEGPVFKLGEHAPATPTTADTRDFVVDPAARERAVAYVREWLPGLDSVPRSDLTCLYTSTANEDFILDRTGPFVVCSACSGHGAKFTPLIGELVADLVDGAPPVARFALPAGVDII